MNPRIEKKVSKRLVQIAPKLFKGAWIDREVEWWPKYWKHDLNCDLTALEKKRNKLRENCRVNCVPSVGGGVDYWGEGEDYYTCFRWLCNNWAWVGEFPSFPLGHESYPYPDTGKFKPTARNLIKLARDNDSD